jgi:hypothetical protein
MTMKVEFSQHSLDRLKIRASITKVMVLETLKNPDDTVGSNRGRILYQKRYRELILEVVAVKEDNKLVVITEYFLEQ